MSPSASASGPASGSAFTKTSGPQRSARSGTSSRPSRLKPGSRSERGAPWSEPSRRYVQAWYGQRIVRPRPSSSTRTEPRWRQTFANARSASSSPRTTIAGRSPSAAGNHDPGSGGVRRGHVLPRTPEDRSLLDAEDVRVGVGAPRQDRVHGRERTRPSAGERRHRAGAWIDSQDATTLEIRGVQASVLRDGDVVRKPERRPRSHGADRAVRRDPADAAVVAVGDVRATRPDLRPRRPGRRRPLGGRGRRRRRIP